ncbi:hypothetical protein K2X33_02860 [bacterium]|nr:hypothetical protein [bacterium]
MPATTRRKKNAFPLVATAALAAAFSSVAYELLLASYATFLLGASIFQYSLVFSLMMASMGAGAWLAEKTRQSAWEVFFKLEIAIALTAMAAVPLLYLMFAVGGPAQTLLFVFVVLLGGALGMEVPLLNRVEKQSPWLTEILFYDYLGGFIGGLAFPFLFLPYLGFFRLAAFLALLNALIAVAFVQRFAPQRRSLVWVAYGTLALCVAYAFGAETLRVWMERVLFGVKTL